MAWPSKAPFLPSFVPSFLSHNTDKMTLWERLQNVVFYFLTIVSLAGGSAPGVTHHLHGRPLPSYVDLVSRADLCLRLRTPITETPRPLNPNMINIGGIMARPGSLVTREWQSILDLKERTILVSFGTTFGNFSDVIAGRFLEAFSI